MVVIKVANPFNNNTMNTKKPKAAKAPTEKKLFRFIITSEGKTTKTDDEETVKKKIAELRAAEEREFKVTNTETESTALYQKETYQKNYKVTTGSVEKTMPKPETVPPNADSLPAGTV